MQVKVKICGIRSVASARVAVDAGADFIGLNFVPSSKRSIDFAVAKEIRATVHGKVTVVGVFQNEKRDVVNELSTRLSLDLVQLHGEEDDTYIRSIKYPVMKAVTAKTAHSFANKSCVFLLLDREKQGTGISVDKEFAKVLAKQYPESLFLAGGLDCENVAAMIKFVRPFAVDVASGVETEGREDFIKIQTFIKKCRGE
jgi:phosphoribosylanthranilate isomerase